MFGEDYSEDPPIINHFTYLLFYPGFDLTAHLAICGRDNQWYKTDRSSSVPVLRHVTGQVWLGDPIKQWNRSASQKFKLNDKVQFALLTDYINMYIYQPVKYAKRIQMQFVNHQICS